MKIPKVLCILLCLVFLAGMLSACGAEYTQKDAMTGAVAENESPELSDSGGTEGTVQPENRKLIRTVNMNAETERLDDTLALLDARVNELGGYYQNRSVYNGSSSASRSRYADLIIRIPVEKMDRLIDQVSENTNITSVNESSKDVTLNYVATQSRITALETEETRLLELLAKAESMEDLLKIESRLTGVRTELEEVNSQLRLYDNLVDYATVELYIREVKVYTVVEEKAPSFWQRISEGFSNSMKNLGHGLTELLIFLIICLPYLIPAAVILLGVFLAVHLKNKKKQQTSKKNPSEHPHE